MTKSQTVVAALKDKYPEIRSVGFAKSLREQFPDDPDFSEHCPFVPDAFAIYPDDREVNVIEVVDSHPISQDKGRHIYEYADLLLGLGWNLSVVVFDAEGQISARVHGLSFLPYGITGNGNNVLPAAIAQESARAAA